MAIAHGDGSITLTTSVDTKGIKNFENNAKGVADNLSTAFRKTGVSIETALAKGDTKTAQMISSFQKATAAVEEQRKKVEELKQNLSHLNGKVEVDTTKLEELKAKADDAKRNLAEVYSQAIGKSQVTYSDAVTADVNNISEAYRQQYTEALKAEISARQAYNTQSRAAESTKAELQRLNDELDKEEKKYSELSDKAEIAGAKVNNSLTNMEKNTSSVADGFSKIGNRITRMAKTALFFYVFRRLFTNLRNEIGTVIMSNDQFRASLERLKSSMWTLSAPIFNAVIPAIITLINWLNSALTAVAKFVSMITGKSYSSMVANGEALKNQAAGYKAVGSGSSKAAKGMKEVTKEAEKQLAAFDDLQILQSQDTGDGAGGAGGGAGGVAKQSTDGFGDLDKEIQQKLLFIESVAGGALLAIGLILLFTSGPSIYSLGCIATGAILLIKAWVELNEWDGGSGIKANLDFIMQAAAGAALAIGLMLLFVSGVSPLALGLIAGGAALLAFIAVDVFKDNLPQIIQNHLDEIKTIAALAVLALGIILICLGGGIGIAIGIGLVVAGAAELAREAVQDKDALKEKINDVFDNVGTVLVGITLVAIGILLCIGQYWGFGIGCIAAGATALAYMAYMHKDAIKNVIVDVFGNVGTIIVGITLVAIGVLLCVGQFWGFGIGCIAAGAASIAAFVAINWDAVKNAVSEFLKDNSGLIVGVSTAIMIVGIILCMCGIITPLSIGMIVAGGVVLAAEIALNFNKIHTEISTFIRENSLLIIGVGIALVVIGVILCVCGVIPLGIGCLVAGGASLASAIAINKDTIVNTVKEVWGNIKNYWNDNIAVWFTKQKWIDLAGKIGEGLKNGFQSAMNGVIGIVESGINHIVRGLNKLKFDIPDWVPGFGGKRFGFSIGEVSLQRVRLAEGGIVPRATTALIGEAGKEAVLPLEQNTEWMDMLADRIASRIGNNISSATLELDGREFGRLIVEQENRASRIVGPKLVTV